MPTIDENREKWTSYDWMESGDEWSSEWGGTHYLWYGTIYPRIMELLPTETLLEIAPGYGRCTQYLLPLCRNFIAVDLSQKCIEACRKRFDKYPLTNYFVNDGKSLDMLEDDSLDFVFSWDSLVHVESDVVFSYLKYLGIKLKKGGYGFIHHSNIGSFKDPATGELTVANPHWRGASMSAELFREYCSQAGLTCLTQEIVGWGGEVLTDCFSLFAKNARPGHHDTVISENKTFMHEAFRLRKIAELYHPFRAA
jgi:SAM-dependent methyltransferase